MTARNPPNRSREGPVPNTSMKTRYSSGDYAEGLAREDVWAEIEWCLCWHQQTSAIGFSGVHIAPTKRREKTRYTSVKIEVRLRRDDRGSRCVVLHGLPGRMRTTVPMRQLSEGLGDELDCLGAEIGEQHRGVGASGMVDPTWRKTLSGPEWTSDSRSTPRSMVRVSADVATTRTVSS